MSLVGTALFSMAFLFSVTVSNASFSGVESPIPDVMGPQNVMAVLDVASNSYSSFLATNLFNPAQESFALAADNISYIAENAGYELATLTGYQGSSSPQVAGASVSALHSVQ